MRKKILSIALLLVFCFCFGMIGYFFALLIGNLLEWEPDFLSKIIFEAVGFLFGALFYLQLKKIASTDI